MNQSARSPHRISAIISLYVRAIGRSHSPRDQHSQQRGFTLLELLVVLIMVGILMAIGAPTWLSMSDNQRLGAPQDEAFRALRLAQAKARQQKRIWEACFRASNDGQLQYSVHPTRNAKCSNAAWQPLGAEAATFTTIDTALSTLTSSQGAYVVQFNASGWLASGQDAADSRGNEANAQSKRLVFQMTNRPDLSSRTCLYVDSLLGSLRAARDADCTDTRTP
jgi:prepilin-type N-terminal cleavage/methylation domain-containing protein